MPIAIEVDRQGESAVLSVRGDLDVATAPQLRDALVSVIAPRCRVVVDLEAVDFVDSAGLGILVSGLKRARAQGGELELVCTSRSVLRPFEITGLDRVFKIHARREEATGR